MDHHFQAPKLWLLFQPPLHLKEIHIIFKFTIASSISARVQKKYIMLSGKIFLKGEQHIWKIDVNQFADS